MQIPVDFKDLDLYDVLNIPNTSTPSEIKKAYRRRALQTHPDKAGEESHLEFQKVTFAYSILSDEERRKYYDQLGTVEDLEEASLKDLFNKYFRVEITEEMIEQDKKEYRESGEEYQDILRFYNEFNGDFDLILESTIHTEIDDQTRLIDTIEKAIESGELAPTKLFKTTASKKAQQKRLKKSTKESIEATKIQKKLGVNTKTEDDLASLIRLKSKSRFDNFMDRLEDKYKVSKPTKATKKSKKK